MFRLLELVNIDIENHRRSLQMVQPSLLCVGSAYSFDFKNHQHQFWHITYKCIADAVQYFWLAYPARLLFNWEHSQQLGVCFNSKNQPPRSPGRRKSDMIL
jgi:hypothetical protein